MPRRTKDDIGKKNTYMRAVANLKIPFQIPSSMRNNP